MPEILLARAQKLHRPADRLGGMDRLDDIVGHDLATEAAAQEGDVDLDRLGLDADGCSDGVLAGRNRLDRPPDLDGAVLVGRRGIHRLERRVGDMGQHEAPLDHRLGALLENLARPAGLDGGDSLFGIERLVQQAVDTGCRQIATGAGIEGEIERVGGALGLPESIGHDAYRIVPRLLCQAGMLRTGFLVGDVHGG